MIVDNKAFGEIKVHEWLSREVGEGRLDIVSGFFTVGALAWLAKETMGKTESYRMVLGDLAISDNQEARAALLDLMSTSVRWEDAFSLSSIARDAVAFLRETKVEIRTTRPDFCHAKLFQHHSPQKRLSSGFITGSANLTEAGLGIGDQTNWELNMLGQGSSEDFKALTTWFESLWTDPRAKTEFVENGRRITAKDFFIERIESLFRKYAPKEVYLRMLSEVYPETRIESDVQHVRLMERLEHTAIWDSLYPFQRGGVIDLIQKMERQGGAILADAVGLGKTWSALAVMKYYQLQGRECLLLCPKKLDHNWMRYLKGHRSRFERDKFAYHVRYHTSLAPDLFAKGPSGRLPLEAWHSDAPKLVVIDESHNFRNDSGNRYKFLMDEILRKNEDIRVLLLSATPLNTDIRDVRNQLKLLVKGADDGFSESLGIPRLEEPFRQASRVFRDWTNETSPKLKTVQVLKSRIPEPVKELFDKVVVARNRSVVARHDSNLKFPSHLPPRNLFLPLPKVGKYAGGIQAILDQLPDIFPAYSEAWYARKADSKNQFDDDATRTFFLTRLLHVLLAKRLESSWASFRSTIDKLLQAHEQVQQALAQWKAGKRKAARVELDQESLEFEDDWSDELPRIVIDFAKIEGFKRLKSFQEDLDHCCYRLSEILKALEEFGKKAAKDPKADPKLWALRELLREKTKRPNPRVLLFTAFSDTAKYLYEELREEFPRMSLVTGTGTECVSSDAPKDFESLLDRFAPRTRLYREREWKGFDQDHPDRTSKGRFEAWSDWIPTHDPKAKALLENPIEILVATDVLSEGQNLQDCDLVVNFDIHWNPVRLVQRFGRIDRLESPNDQVGLVNFWPSRDVEEYLNLKSRVESRMVAGGLVEQEALATSDEVSERIKDEEADRKATERYLKQLERSIDELESEGLDMADLADDRFRAELVNEMRKNLSDLRRIPRGIYSGFSCVGKSPDKIRLVALLGYPRRTPHEAKAGVPYQSTHLICLDAKGNALLPDKLAVLEHLSLHKEDARDVPPSIDERDPKALTDLRGRVDSWLTGQRLEEAPDGSKRAGAKSRAALAGLLAGGIRKSGRVNANTATDAFLSENLDLVAWMVFGDQE